ncbi:TPA: recombinase family protein [Enterococcus faecalis]|jgi:DNA invertase Pin-like site-specific DNA recombinase|uniref:Resolvase n=3 Tax=Bacilli TaxID=91061 RepID=A0A640MLN6_BACAN|nr:recombinase family protein [Enterococcus faecalis]GEU13050.1 resolvase [Bacillus anthracis]EGO7767522.1 recombinase family protein [Enterococcus faecalis]EGO8922522.1 recombinase family protein [Enterococcus faecalis]EKE4879789.1 recombinase family protein [Enterococcus faecalis]EKS9943338.1 recombinase family protein [Enterococcus faecalis]
MKYGYVRVSTKNQFEKETYLKQIETLKSEGVLEENIYIENVSGKNTKDRPIFNKLLGILKENDTLIVTKLDRLARNTADALKIAELLTSKNITLNILNMGILDNKPSGKLMFTMFSAFAEFERNLIAERMLEGREYKRQNDVSYKEGRKHKLNTNQLKHLHQHFETNQYTNKELASIFSVSQKTIATRKKEWRDLKNLDKS